jgi:hypothetical protein
MGNTFGTNGLSIGSSLHVSWSKCLVVEVTEIIIHKADQPDPIADLFDTDALAGEDEAEIDFLALKQIRPHVVTVTVLSWNG